MRAMAIVPLVFLRPFLDSRRMGWWVLFCWPSGVKPPPWIMKPGMTRWIDGAVEEALLHVLHEVVDGDGGFVPVELDLYVALCGF